MRQRIHHWYNYLLSTLLWMLGFGMMGCTEQGDEYGTEPPIPENLSIDQSFRATLSYLHGEWAAEYEGWDNVQKRSVTIRRKLQLAEDGTYQNLIGGHLPNMKDEQEFVLLESEGGTYTYLPSSRTITYTCKYDSVLQFETQKLVCYGRKHYWDHEEDTYTEKVQFTEKRNGKREWVTYDPFLVPQDDKDAVLEYRMNRLDGNYGKRRAQRNK